MKFQIIIFLNPIQEEAGKFKTQTEIKSMNVVKEFQISTGYHLLSMFGIWCLWFGAWNLVPVF